MIRRSVEKNNSFEPSGNPKITILVDPMVVSVIAAGAFIKLLRESRGRYRQRGKDNKKRSCREDRIFL